MISFRNQRGVAIIITILLIGFLLSMVFALSAIFIPKLRASSEIKSSVGAMYAADTAVEWCIYRARKDDTAVAPIMDIGSAFTVSPSDCTSPIKVLGTYRGVTRAFEVSF